MYNDESLHNNHINITVSVIPICIFSTRQIKELIMFLIKSKQNAIICLLLNINKIKKCYFFNCALSHRNDLIKSL